ncbi:MAG: hypothetical protein EOO77_00780, partial [Oxalobacteraceae bacterium]
MVRRNVFGAYAGRPNQDRHLPLHSLKSAFTRPRVNPFVYASERARLNDPEGDIDRCQASLQKLTSVQLTDMAFPYGRTWRIAGAGTTARMRLLAETTRRRMIAAGATMAGVVAIGLGSGTARAQNGFMTASAGSGGPPRRRSGGPGLQGITALCEVTGGGQKIYGIAIEYDTAIEPASLDLATYATGVVPA